MDIEHVEGKHGQTLAIIVKASYETPGVSFFTEPTASLQVGYVKQPKDHQIKPHRHFTRSLSHTSSVHEILMLRKGKMRVDFYDDQERFIVSRVLLANDVLIQFSGGHGFTVEEDVELVEVKHGPYVPELDKKHIEEK